jgi:hypothetical protein
MRAGSRTIDVLVHWTGGPCVSLYCPVDRCHPDDRAEHAAFERLVAAARDEFARLDTEVPDGFEAIAEEILERDHLRADTGSLAVFAAPGFTAQVDLDVLVDPVAKVTDRFHLLPLLHEADHSTAVHVLAPGGDDLTRSSKESADARVVADLSALAGTGRVCGDVAELADAAALGRVCHVYLSSTRPQEADLVNVVVTETLRHNGQVRLVTTASLPGGASVLGVLRY